MWRWDQTQAIASSDPCQAGRREPSSGNIIWFLDPFGEVCFYDFLCAKKPAGPWGAREEAVPTVGHAGPPQGSGPWRPQPGGSGMWLAQSFVTVAMAEQGPRLTGNWRCPPWGTRPRWKPWNCRPRAPLRGLPGGSTLNPALRPAMRLCRPTPAMSNALLLHWMLMARGHSRGYL